MLECLAWHTVHVTAPAEDKEVAAQILQGRALRSPWHAQHPHCAPPRGPDDVAAPEGGEEAAEAAPGAGGAIHQGCILRGLAPLWAPLEAVSPDPMVPAPPRGPGSPGRPRGDAREGQLTPGRSGG